MMTVIGIIFGLICVFSGYLLHGGHMTIFVHAWTEFVVILGGAMGIYIAGNGPKVVQQTIQSLLNLLKPDPFTKQEFTNLLVMLFQILTVARNEGLLGLEVHLEDPHKSSIMKNYPVFLHDHHACAFFCDTMKVIVQGGVKPHDLDAMMEIDLDQTHAEEHIVPEAVQNMGDAMPAVGIVACVLGVIITMGKIGGDPAEIGAAIGVALVGTFLGVMVAYIVFAPIARALGLRLRPGGQYMSCIRHAIFSFARGEGPMTCIEFARRNIDPSTRPSFAEVEAAVKAARGKKAA